MKLSLSFLNLTTKYLSNNHKYSFQMSQSTKQRYFLLTFYLSFLSELFHLNPRHSLTIFQRHFSVFINFIVQNSDKLFSSLKKSISCDKFYLFLSKLSFRLVNLFLLTYIKMLGQYSH